MRRADPFSSFIQSRGYKTSKVHSVVNRNNTGKTKSNPRASVGRRSANNIQQGKAKGKSRKHGQVSTHGRTGEARLEQYRGLCRVAIAWTYAIQYSAEGKRKSMVYVGCVINCVISRGVN